MAFGIVERINEDLYKQGIEKGIEKERLKLYKAAQAALALGLPVSQVATIFGLSEEAVQNIRLIKLEGDAGGN
jgi:predicted transposase YdaD